MQLHATVLTFGSFAIGLKRERMALPMAAEGAASIWYKHLCMLWHDQRLHGMQGYLPSTLRRCAAATPVLQMCGNTPAPHATRCLLALIAALPTVALELGSHACTHAWYTGSCRGACWALVGA